MGRVFKVVLYAVLILILYLWITAIMNSRRKMEANRPEPTLTEEAAEQIDSLSTADDMESSSGDDFISNEDIVSGKIPYKDVDKTIQELSNKQSEKPKNQAAETATQKAAENTKKTVEQPIKSTQPASAGEPSKPAKKPEPVQSTTVSIPQGGDYMVVAGSYILEDNANKMVKKLRGMGYDNAEVVIFTASEYYSVVASRHPTHESAQLAADAMKRKGIDCFVKKKN